MKNLQFKKLIITNLPAFYKTRLFNEINKEEKILVIYTGNGQEIRNKDFFQGEINFDYIDFSRKHFFLKYLQLLKIVLFSDFNELLIGGWDEVSLWISALFSPKSKNALILESSVYESKTVGLKRLLKNFFLKRINKVYASGKSQIDLLNDLGFNGKIVKTKGVGIFNYRPQPLYEEKFVVKNFLYVGRLSKEKNLDTLIKVFNNKPKLKLNIVGFGPLRSQLESISNKNICFYGAVNNLELYKIYRENDVFILPSTVEPWGMVVEEALNNGLPVIVSNKVGCSEEIVDLSNGLVFDVNNNEDLDKCIQQMQDLKYYNNLRNNISRLNFEEMSREQINSYLL